MKRNTNWWLGIVLGLVILLAGLYFALWSGVILGLVQVIDGVKASPTNSWDIELGLFRVFALPPLCSIGVMVGWFGIRVTLLD